MNESQGSKAIVWLLLMTATVVLTWGLSEQGLSLRIATVATVLIAAWKVRLVLLKFMELERAPWGLRGLFEGWVVLAVGAILIPYLLT